MSLYFEGRKQSVEDILKARDMRVSYQRHLIETYKSTIVSYKLNIPGSVKYNSLIKQIFDEGILTFKEELEKSSIDIVYEKAWYKDSGPEYFACFNMPADFIKKITISIEENHPLGRLYDFDVLNHKGNQVSREELKAGSRKCLICNNDAFLCSRSRRHEVSELIDKIESMALDYFNGKRQ